jgi:hypothetical protein
MSNSKTVREFVRGQLTSDKGKPYNVNLILTVQEMHVDEVERHVGRALSRVELAPRSGGDVPEGRYTLTFPFDGTQQRNNVRLESGTLLSG